MQVQMLISVISREDGVEHKCFREDPAVLQLLIGAGADLNTGDKIGRRPSSMLFWEDVMGK